MEETLEGRASDLKERTLGIAVFERDPDYDTSDDHIVRSAAAEVPIGSYVPHSRIPPKNSESRAMEQVPAAGAGAAVAQPDRPVARISWVRKRVALLPAPLTTVAALSQARTACGSR